MITIQKLVNINIFNYIKITNVIYDIITDFHFVTSHYSIEIDFIIISAI